MEARNFFEKVIGVSDITALDSLEHLAEFKKVSSGEEIFEEGRQQSYIVFLLKGILRGFYVDENGHEITDCFMFRFGTPVISNFGFEDQCAVTIEAAVNSEILRIPMAETMELLNSSMECMHIYNKLVQESFRCHWEMKGAILQYSAMGRYQWFLNTYPGLIDRVNNRHIASFLGMTPVTLSRIRRSLREGKTASPGNREETSA